MVSIVPLMYFAFDSCTDTQLHRFNAFHPESVQSAKDRYAAEVRRILGVLDGVLSHQQWLVGDKLTFADLAFVPWNWLLDLIMATPGQNPVNEFPAVKAWHERMISRPAFKKMDLIRQKYMEEQGIVPATGLPEGQTLEQAIAAAEEEKRKQMGL